MDLINEYLAQHRKVIDLGEFRSGWVHLELRPKVVCQDGFSVSVQASQTHYSAPRDVVGPYCQVECGYPSSEEELLIPFMEIDTADPTDTVYPYVPVEVVEAVIEKHGGIK